MIILYFLLFLFVCYSLFCFIVVGCYFPFLPSLRFLLSLSLFFDKQIDDHRKLHVAWDLIFTVPWATILSKNCIISDTCIVNTLDGCYNCNGYSFFLSFIAGSSIAWSSNLNKHNGIVPFEDTHTHILKITNIWATNASLLAQTFQWFNMNEKDCVVEYL